MATPVVSDRDHLNASRITNLPNPTAAQDAATKGYVDSAVEGLAWKDSARVSTQANIGIASPGATIDGITMVANDRVLVRAQTAGAENGLYIWNGAAVPMTRSTDADTAPELEQAVVTVEEGTSTGATFRQTVLNFTLGTTTVTWVNFGTSAPAASTTVAGIVRLATQAEVDAGTDGTISVTPLMLTAWASRIKRGQLTYGDGTATQYDFTHNLGTRDIIVQVYETTGLFRQVDVEIQALSINVTRVIHKVAPAAGAYRLVLTA